MAGRHSRRQIKYNAEVKELLAGYGSAMNKYSDEVIALLKKASEELTEKLAVLYKTAGNSWEKVQLANINQQILETLNTYKNGFDEVMGKALAESARNGSNLVVTPMKNNIDASLFLNEPSLFVPVSMDNAVRATWNISSTLITEITQETASKINERLILGLIQNKPPFEIVSQVTGLLQGNKLGFPTLNARSWAIFRTETSRMFSNATMLQMNQASEIIPESRKQWNHGVFGLGLYKRVGHEALDGDSVLMDESFTNPVTKEVIRFPHDPLAPASEVVNCGCALSMVMPDDSYLRDKTLVNV